MAWKPWQQAALLAGITFAAFSATLSADFVYDARMQILSGDFIHEWRNWPAVLTGRVLGMDVLDFNRPVHVASLMLDHRPLRASLAASTRSIKGPMFSRSS